MAEAQGGAAPAAAAAPAAGDAPKADPWTGLVGVGLVALSGNSETLTFTANGQVDKKFGEWALGARATGAYGQSRPTPEQDSQVVALRAGVSLRGDRNIASFASIFAGGGAETDHVKSVEVRGFGELGAGIKFLEVKRNVGQKDEWEREYIRADLAFRYSRETRFQYYATPTVPTGGLPGVTLIAPRVAGVFRFALTPGIRFSEELEFLPNIAGDARFLFNSNTKLSARLTESLALTASFLMNYDSAPAGGKKPLDTALAMGIEAAF
ncbi:MAG: DUF481 domain-containing protein [Myxococcaceae bacterium]|nr:DUF481 domain-containing protein [Myxococcaceae bacterium]